MTLFSPPNPTTAAADASDAELLRAFARSRDELAFGRLVARHAAAVRRIALRQTGNPFAAEDVAQATYLVLSGRLGPAARSAARRGSVRPWLARTCRYCAANWRRGERRRRRRERVAAVPERVDPSRPGELAEAVVAAMGRLGGRDRKLIELHHLDEQPWPQVAAELKLTPEAAKRAGARAMERLRDALSRRGITASAGALLAAVAALVRPARANALPSAAAYEVAKGTLLMLKLQTVAVTVAALAVVAGLTGSLAVALQGDGGAASPSAAVAAQPAAPATKPAPRVPLVVKFADNAVWNLVALGDGASSWRPDGTPTDEPRLNLPGLAQGKVGDATLPPAEDGRRWLAVLLAPEDKPVGDRVNVAAADTADEPGIEAPRVADSPERVVLVNVPADAALKLVLTAPVTAWAKIDATTPGMSASATFGLGGWTYFGQPAELDGNATVSVFFSDPTGESRVLAVDKAKKPHAGRPAVAETPKGRMLATTFADLPLADVAQFVAQRRNVATASVTVAGAPAAKVAAKVEAVRTAAAPTTAPAAEAKLPARAAGVPITFDTVPFADALTFLQAVAGTTIETNEAALVKAGIDPVKVRLGEISLTTMKDASLGEVLSRVAELADAGGATLRVYVHRDGRIIFTTPADAEAHRGDWAEDPDAAIKARAERK